MTTKEEEAIHFVERNGMPAFDCRSGVALRLKPTERDVDRPEQTRPYERWKARAVRLSD